MKKNQIDYSRIMKPLVIFTFLLSILLYYSNPDQFISDNSLFYPVVAENIWTTGISTFNGYIETNGYQPLWMLASVLSVGISSLFSFDLLMTIGFFYHLFLLGSIILIYKMAKAWPFYNPHVVSVVLIFMFISNGVLHNMESAMALFFVLLTLDTVLKMESVNTKNFFIVGLLFGLTFLSRLDLIFFDVVLLTYLFFRQRENIAKKPWVIILLLLGVMVVLLPYLLHNITTFGHWLPISERLSQGLPSLSYAWANIYPYGAVSLVIAMIEWGIAWTARTREARAIILIMSISTILQIIYVAFFQHPQSWYFITGFINFAIIIGYLLKKFNIIWLTNISFILLVLVTIGTSYLKTISNFALSAHVLKLYQDKVGTAPWIFDRDSEQKKLAKEFRKKLSKHATIFTWYYPGSLAYYGKFHVFSAAGVSDGLIANHRYDNEIVKNGIWDTFKKYNVEYITVLLTQTKQKWYSSLEYIPDDNETTIKIYAKQNPQVCGKIHFFTDENNANIIYSEGVNVAAFKIKDMKRCDQNDK